MQLMQVIQVMQVLQVMQVMQVMLVMQIMQDRICTKKVTISSSAIWWPNLELMQVAPFGGHICN